MVLKPVLKSDLISLREVFMTYDKNHDGHITLAEMQAEFDKQRHELSQLDVISKFGRQPARGRGRREEDRAAFSASLARALFNEIDSDGDGRVTFKEALAFLYPKVSEGRLEAMVRYAFPEKPKEDPAEVFPSSEQEVEISTIFRLFDKDGSGGLDRRELTNALHSSGFDRAEIEQLHHEFDLDGSGVIELDEFRALMLASGLYGSAKTQVSEQATLEVSST